VDIVIARAYTFSDGIAGGVLFFKIRFPADIGVRALFEGIFVGLLPYRGTYVALFDVRSNNRDGRPRKERIRVFFKRFRSYVLKSATGVKKKKQKRRRR